MSELEAKACSAPTALPSAWRGGSRQQSYLAAARLLVAALAIVAFGRGAVAQPSAATSSDKAISSSGLPDELKRSAIATRSDTVGMIAGGRISGTDIHVVYMRTARGCGTGGCRAQVWKQEGAGFVQVGSTPAGRLPIVVLPGTVQGLPLLGVTVVDGAGTRLAVLPVGFDGSGFKPSARSRLLPTGSGIVLITPTMLQPF